MDLPINDKDLATIPKSLTLGGDTSLYNRLKIVKEVRDDNPGGPYKKIIREKYGMVFLCKVLNGMRLIYQTFNFTQLVLNQRLWIISGKG